MAQIGKLGAYRVRTRHDRDEREQRDPGREHRQPELRVAVQLHGSQGLISPPRPSSRSGSARATMPVCASTFSPSTSGAGRGQALQALESFHNQSVDSFGCFLHWVRTRTARPRRRMHAQSGLQGGSRTSQQDEGSNAHDSQRF